MAYFINPHDQMTPEEMNVKIAELCGWTKCRLAIKGAGAPGHRKPTAYGIPPERNYEADCPSYTSDLNACAEMEKTLRNCEIEWSRYRHYIETHVPYADQITATAMQRCTAFLAVKEQGGNNL